MGVPDKKRLIQPHLSDAQIIAYCDGELSNGQKENARAHIESCWSCRGRMRELQTGVDRFLEARSMLPPVEPAFSEFRAEQFRQRLARHASTVGSQNVSWTERLKEWVAPLRAPLAKGLEHRKAVLASATAVCLLVVMFTDIVNTRVSADTVLAKAENYEARQAPRPGYVARTSIRVDRINANSAKKEMGTITLWKDSTSAKTHISAKSAAGTFEDVTVQDVGQASSELMGVMFSANQEDAAVGKYLAAKDWFPDLSIGAFRRLVEARGNTSVSANKADGMFELHYPFEAGTASTIVETTLRVDADEYAPTSLSIFTTNGDSRDEYRFTRTSLFAELRTPDIAEMFPPIEESRSPMPERPVSQANRVVPLTYANSPATESEVSLALELHKIDSCLGEEIYLFPMSDGSLLVQGLVDSPSRRERIREALHSARGTFRVEIYVPRELKNGSELYKPPDQAIPEARSANDSATLSDLSGTSVPLHEMLYQHFYKPGTPQSDTDKEVALFSNQVVTLARQAFLHAWALKKLNREFSSHRTSGLPAATLLQVEQMREDHRHWLTTIASREAEMLISVAGPEIASSANQITTAQDSDALLQLAQEQNDLVRSLFTISSQSSATTSGLARLIHILKQMES